jgi:beta-lysine 5,6-aminomutase alpha subunit
MTLLPIDPEVVAACRDKAGAIADRVQAFIDRHSTVSIERTVLRAYGVEGADPDGVGRRRHRSAGGGRGARLRRRGR